MAAISHGVTHAVAEEDHEVRGDADAALFALDRHGDCYVQERTRRSIREPWQVLVTSRLSASAAVVEPVMPAGPSLAPGTALAADAMEAA